MAGNIEKAAKPVNTFSVVNTKGGKPQPCQPAFFAPCHNSKAISERANKHLDSRAHVPPQPLGKGFW